MSALVLLAGCRGKVTVTDDNVACSADYPTGHCPSGETCREGRCVDDSVIGPVTCTDGMQNGDETGVDCGGSCAACVTCTDGVQNGGETGVDCGGPECAACVECDGGDDCPSGLCSSSGTCAAPACDDGVLNGDETDEDCGGSCATASPARLCGEGAACELDVDCATGVCEGAVCVPPACDDERRNGGETGIDCGGPSCAACLDGDPCLVPSDCASGACDVSTLVCAAPSCNDGVKNGSETGIDCGGSCPSSDPPGTCDVEEPCAGDQDCTSGVCQQESCRVADCGDGVENGDETATDCGGLDCQPCGDGSACGRHADCMSGVCLGLVCQVATCSDSVRNQDETDVDCGGSCADCVDGKACTADTDCASGSCVGNVCRAPSCANGTQDAGESDVDCGGSCPRCADGDACTAGTDCTSGVCGAGSTCAAPTCSDGVKNGGETGADCGITACATACAPGQGCATDYDCSSRVCDPASDTCQPPACNDGRRNGDETAVDCGGSCGPCADGAGCGVAADCQSGVCGAGGQCAAPTCSDGVKNGDETGDDCGGSCASSATCPVGSGCQVDGDCTSGECVAGVCVEAHCTNGAPDSNETGTDCGGPDCGDCPTGQGCAGDGDCQSGVCSSSTNTCAAPSCSDGVRNGDELGADCGGTCVTGCADGSECVANDDCASGVCTTQRCQVPRCNDGVKNGDEGGVDCGGSCTATCPDLSACNDDDDCASGVCTTSICQPPSCSPADGVKNGSETAVDCGGPGCPDCADGATCNVHGDCASGVCAGGTCQVPSCDPADGVKNGSETDVDCGGTGCPDCANGQGCSASADCTSGYCNSSGRCASADCNDGVKNGDETAVDCGGPDCSACAAGAACNLGTDCASSVCTDGTGANDNTTCTGGGTCCQAPSCNDGVKNGDEGDADCGGSDAGCARCQTNDTCNAAGDCDSGVCMLGTCRAPQCGDNVVNGGEVCDDGNTLACVGGCSANCMQVVSVTGCGDGILCGTEGCDQGAGNTTDCAYGETSCTVCHPTTCQLVAGETDLCGDGTKDDAGGEECDNGAANTTACAYGQTSCTVCHPTTCQLVAGTTDYCGDSVTDTASGEECDDGAGNTTECAYGLASCTVCHPTTCKLVAGDTDVCGDGVTDASGSEGCDDGPANTTTCAYGQTSCKVCHPTTCELVDGTTSYCGDGAIDPGNGEQCDDGDATDSGNGCSATCQRNDDCGNGHPESLYEQCDDGNEVTEQCPYGVASCTVCSSTCQNVAGETDVCGDGVLDTPDELCDGAALGGATCTSVGGFVGGVLQCNSTCDGYVLTACQEGCGNGSIEGSEVCDDGGTADPADDVLAGKDCTDFNFYGGTLACNGSCTGFDTSACAGECGDGTKDAGEACDGTDFGDPAATCANIGQGYSGGSLGCTTTCTLDVSACTGCGDGALDSGETCDDNDTATAADDVFAGGVTCASIGQGFTGGTLQCNTSCDGYVTTACFTCGNGVVDEGEVCDVGATSAVSDDVLDGATCANIGQGFDAGVLACNASCTGYVVTGCSDCGNGVIEGAEVCDSQALDGKTCVTEGFLGGNLACASDCGGVDTSACQNCPSSCPTGATCSADTGGECVCPVYLTACGGACVSTHTDPDNCGECGNACDVAGGEVCSAGKCVASCQEPLVACDGRCVDLRTDNQHCGACNTPCTGGKVCDGSSSSTTCIDPTVTLNTPAKCADGGPPINFNDGTVVLPEPLECAGDLAAVSFRWAACSCRDVEVKRLLTDGYDSADGPYEALCEDRATPCVADAGCAGIDLDGDGMTTCAGSVGAGLGANRVFDSEQDVRVWGTAWWEEASPTATVSTLTVKQKLYCGGDLPGAPRVTQDAYVRGDVETSTGYVRGNLHLSSGSTVQSGFTVDGSIIRASGTLPMGEPCDCDSDELVPVVSIIDAHACTGATHVTCPASNNDNALVGLNPSVFETNGGRVDLPCGHYYLSEITPNNSDVTIVVNGRTALYIDGSIDPGNGSLVLQLSDSAELDVFVKGYVDVSSFRFGSPNYPARARLYVAGGSGGATGPGGSGISTSSGGRSGLAFNMPQTAQIAGNVYAPWGQIRIVQTLNMYGSLFAGHYYSAQEAAIHFDTSISDAGDSCPSDCGNGQVDFGEVCDGTDLDGATCATQGFSGGTLFCNSTCDGYDTSACYGCGDDVVNTGEDCEPVQNPLDVDCSTAVGSGYSGTVTTCNADCTYNVAPCHLCGNGTVEAGELCDGAAIGGATCQSQGFQGGTLVCNATCDGYVTDGCYRCGDGDLDPGEQCDPGVAPANFGGLTCADFGYDGGSLACRANCTINTNPCTRCGDLVKEGSEQCDGTDLGGLTCSAYDPDYNGGTLRCTASCTLDDSLCTDCGDGVREGSEQCDGTDLNGKTCADFGLVDDGAPDLACKTNCTFDTGGCGVPNLCGNCAMDSGEQCDPGDGSCGATIPVTCQDLGFTGGTIASCTSSCTPDVSGCTMCGDGLVEGDEECESGVTSCSGLGLGYEGGQAACVNCAWETSTCTNCNNGILEPGEECDGTDFGGLDCGSFGHAGGVLVCSSTTCLIDDAACYSCGDHVVNGDEECEPVDGAFPGDLGGNSCTGEGFSGGTLSCKADCSLDTTQCTGCGNGRIEAGEECEGTNLNGRTCTGLGYDGGTLACDTATCQFDETGCTDCGDGVRQGSESCDGTDFGDPPATCVTASFDGGTVSCNANCTLNTGGCYWCGDGTINSGEQCDGTALGGKTCATVGGGYTGGVLACTPDTCTYDTTGCYTCGDGAREGTEECDPGDTGDGNPPPDFGTPAITCQDKGYDQGTITACNANCTVDTSGCSFDVVCGDGVREGSEECDPGDTSDGSPPPDFGTTPRTCQDEGFEGGTIDGCNADCTASTGSCYKCGDGVKNGTSEQCDGDDLGGQTCSTQGFNSGTLTCKSDCTFDTSGCVECGSCRDCDNQACIAGQCGACVTSADCCSPYECFYGTCILY